MPKKLAKVYSLIAETGAFTSTGVVVDLFKREPIETKDDSLSSVESQAADTAAQDDELDQFGRADAVDPEVIEETKKATTSGSRSHPTLGQADHFGNAKFFIGVRYRHNGVITLLHHSSMFYGWETTHYAEVSREQIISILWKFLDAATCDVKTEKKTVTVPFNPNKQKVANTLEALASQAQLFGTVKFPYWQGSAPKIDGKEIAANDVLSCTNSLVHLPTRTLLPHSPAFRNTYALPFKFDPDASKPVAWLAFLDQLWPQDSEARDTLQEWFGLMLTSDTSFQKIALLIGPPRSGKGTIARVLRAMVGEQNVAGPTLANLGTQFGLQPLINKPLGIISDARIGPKTDIQAVSERLLSISGEDALDVPRKNIGDWTGTLPTRFMMLTNVLPKLTDASGAIVSRFIIMQLTQSFYGKEDLGLTKKLLAELPGILNWSLDGLDRLRKRGHFVMPKSAQETLATFESLSNPLGEFISEKCVIAAGRRIPIANLFLAWGNWCTANGRAYHGNVQSFGSELLALHPHLGRSQPAIGGKRVRCYEGIDLDANDVKDNDNPKPPVHPAEDDSIPF